MSGRKDLLTNYRPNIRPPNVNLADDVITPGKFTDKVRNLAGTSFPFCTKRSNYCLVGWFCSSASLFKSLYCIWTQPFGSMCLKVPLCVRRPAFGCRSSWSVKIVSIKDLFLTCFVGLLDSLHTWLRTVWSRQITLLSLEQKQTRSRGFTMHL